MSHESKIVEKKKLSDGQFAVKIVCCGDDSSASWHTLEITKDTKPEDVQAWVSDRHQHVQDGHKTALAVEAHLESLI